MMGPTHRYGGFVTGVIASVYLIPEPYTLEKILFGGIIIGLSTATSTLPDIDHKNSTIGRKYPAISKFVNKHCGHRGLTHAPFFYLILMVASFFAATFIVEPVQTYINVILVGLFTGFFSHLILDIITVDGIPFYYPLSKDRVNIATFKAGKHKTVVCVLITAIMVISIIHKLFL